MLGVVVVVFFASAVPAYAAAPDTVIDTGPPASTNQTTATFTFHAVPAAGATFECRVDAGAFASCTTPYTTTGSLSEGSHTFYVEALTNGVPDPTPASYTWTVDLTPPTTTVTGRPPALTNSRTATFTFSSPDPTATFRCSLNGSAPAPCTSPVIYTGLSDATRTLLIQAVDPAGNVDPTATPITWTVDTTPPDTTLTPPSDIGRARDPQFTFTSSETGSTFECSKGNAPFTACSSPFTVHVPHAGGHRLRVRAIDAAGNVDPTPAVYTWTNDLTPPKRPTLALFGDPAASASAAEASAIGPPIPGSRPISVAPNLPILTSTPALIPILVTPIPLPHLPRSSPFTIDSKVRAEWFDADPTAVSYDVTVTSSGGVLKTLTKVTRTALVLNPGTGNTVCVSVTAEDSVGNVSQPSSRCITIPFSFAPPANVSPLKRVKSTHAWHHYYLVLPLGVTLSRPINMGGSGTVSKIAVVAERCKSCGKLAIGVATNGYKIKHLLTISLEGGGKTGKFMLFTRSPSTKRQRKFGPGYLVLYAVAGKPHISGIAYLGSNH